MLGMGIIICVDSFNEVWHVVHNDLWQMKWETHHSMMALGLLHILRATANILDSLDKVAK